MTTPAKVEANRQNALRSTGPRTTAGKALAAMNATKHGLMSRATLLPSDDAREFIAFADSLRSALVPVGALQELLADHAVACAWRLRRIYTIESALVQGELHEDEQRARLRTFEIGEPLPVSVSGLANGFIRRHDALVNLSRYEAAIDRSMRKSLAELERLQDRAPATIEAMCEVTQ